MEPLFNVSTEYTYERYVAYNKAVINKVNHFYKKEILITVLLFAVAVMGYFTKNQVVCYGFLFAGILQPIALQCKRKSEVKKAWYSNKLVQNITMSLSFYEDYFEQHSKVGDSRYMYQDLYQIIEDKNAFYLMIARNQGTIIDKSNCDEGTCDFIRSLMKRVQANLKRHP